MTLYRIYFFAFLGFLILLSAGCTKIEEIEVGEIEHFEFIGFGEKGIELELHVPVDNPNAFRVRLVDADIDVFLNNRQLGKITEMGDVVIQGRSSAVYPLNVNIDIEDFSGGRVAIMRFLFERSATVTVEGKIKFRAFLVPRTLEVKETVPLDF